MAPIVLHHGLFGHGGITIGSLKLDYFRGIGDAITNAGHRVIVTHVHPTASIENRATQLKKVLLDRLDRSGRNPQKCILMAHSLGGLDARFAVSKLGMDKHIAAIVTVSTPHHGSPFADWVVKNLGRRLRGIQLLNYLDLDLAAVVDLTTQACEAFNENVPDVPGVRYFSVSASRPWNKMPAFALHSHHVVNTAEGDNDGLVSVKSSTYAEHLGTWAADHWHTINHRFTLERNPPTRDIAPLWVGLLEQVKSRLGSPRLPPSHASL